MECIEKKKDEMRSNHNLRGSWIISSSQIVVGLRETERKVKIDYISQIVERTRRSFSPRSKNIPLDLRDGTKILGRNEL